MLIKRFLSVKEMYYEIVINAPLKEIWTYIVDIDNKNKALGLNPVVYEEVPNSRGGSIRIANTVLYGVKTQFIDYPYEWVQYRYVSNERRYTNGFITRFYFHMDCEDHGETCLLRMRSEVEAKYSWMQPLVCLLGDAMLSKLILQNKELEKFWSGEVKVPFQPKSYQLIYKQSEKWKQTLDRFTNFSNNLPLNEKVIDFILNSPMEDVANIRPYALADKIGVKRREVLVLMLRGTTQGVFNMNWDILCPSCRSAKFSSHHLHDLPQNVHCPTCNIEYNSDFDQSVELTFTPHPTIRLTEKDLYCMGSPTKTPHVHTQVRLKKDETREIEIDLEKGSYHIYSLQDSHKYLLEVTDDVESTTGTNWELVFCGGNNRIRHLIRKEGINKFCFINADSTSENEILVKLERTNWLDHIVTAAEVTTMHEFRSQFSSEVLKPGIEIGVKSVTFLFTDLKDSTKFYNNVGDAIAYGVVQDHFTVLEKSIAIHEGAVVKTIGDAVMAVFHSSSHALSAALDIQERINELNEKYPTEKHIILKSGLHCGPALAVNLNNRLDYFGQTVNMAARTSGMSFGGDIVITQYLYNQLDVQQLLNSKKNILIEKQETTLKGFEEQHEIYHIYLQI